MSEPTLFDESSAASEEPDACREHAIDAVAASTNEPWRTAAAESVLECARSLEVFTADDVHEVLGHRDDVHVDTLAALGPVFRQAAKAGWIRSTKTYTPTRLPQRHRDVLVWRSLLCDGAQRPPTGAEGRSAESDPDDSSDDRHATNGLRSRPVGSCTHSGGRLVGGECAFCLTVPEHG